jgi:thiol:disulfide interchange protein
MALIIGVVMVGLGIAMFRGYQLNVGFLKTNAGGTSRDNKSVFSFGVSYALASLSCTLPVFLSVVVGSIAGNNFIAGFLTYIAYGLGMSALLMAVTLAVALAKQRVVRGLRSTLRYVQRVSAAFLVIAGVYITWFWIDDLSSDAGEQGSAARIVEGWSASITNWVQANSTAIGIVAVGSVVITALWVVLKRFEEPTTTPSAGDDERAPMVGQNSSAAN